MGTPICALINNLDLKQSDYSHFQTIPRPGHSDFSYHCKYQVNRSSGGGRSSARETIGSVVTGVFASQYLD
ncbi:MAG: chorismate synthase, partial [bacterium]